MINRCLFTPNGDNPPFPVPLDDLCTVPTEEMACLLASLLLGESQADGDGAGDKDVLEIGTGSGYQTAILASRCRSVLSIDVRMQPSAAIHLPDNVALLVADGYEYDSREQFDGVLVTFGAAGIAKAWIRQLKEGGKLVVPLDSGTGCCRISVFERVGEELRLLEVAAYAPFTPGAEA
jgi:protein-L-isoaspartate(D-aspartate) O-methyltransferase